MDSDSLPPDALVFGELDKDEFLSLAHVSGTKVLRDGYKGNYVAHYTFSTHREKHRKYWTKSVNLSELTSKFPPELFLLIVGSLHPIDLYYFIQTTRGFRNLLLRKDSSAIWRSSFLSHPDIPCFPEDTSPPKWVSLLFGPATCDQCGRFYTLVEFSYRERKCIQCHSLELFYPNRLLSSVEHIFQKYPVIEDVIWLVSRKTFRTRTAYRYPSSKDHELSTPQYSRRDIVKMANKLFDFLEASGENSRQELRQFVREHQAVAENYMEFVVKCESWSNTIYVRCKLRYENSILRALTVGYKILTHLGYDEQDVTYAREEMTMMISATAWSNSKAYKLSRSATQKLLIEFENRVRRAESARKERLGETAYDLRVYVTSATYKTIASEYLKPETSLFVPDYRPILDWPIIQDYVKDKSYKHVAYEQDFPGGVQEQIIDYVANVIEDRKRTLAELVHDAGFVSRQQLSNSMNALSLAAALFEKSCDRYGRNQILIGWADAGKDNWWCYDQSGHSGIQYPIETFVPPHLKYSATGRQALEVIAALVGMDLSSCRAEDLDSLNSRFFCKTCAFTRKGVVFGLNAMNWRECLHHTFSSAQGGFYGALEHCPVPLFDVASDDLTKSILYLEEPWPYGWERAWFCGHCSDIPRGCCARPEVVLHIRNVHGVRRPVNGTDILYEPPFGHETKREMLFVGLAQVSNHRCLRCQADMKSLRLWRLEDVRRHLVDAHKVPLYEQNEGVDFNKINPVADEAWIREGYAQAERAEAGQAMSQ